MNSFITHNRPSIKSTWPTPIGKPLTNRRITHYKKLGYYQTGRIEDSPAEIVKREKKKNAIRKIKKNVLMMLEEFM